MRPNSEIHTAKQDDEHPRPFHVGVPPPPGRSVDAIVISVLSLMSTVLLDICIIFLGVAVAVLDRKLYAAGGFDGRNRLRRLGDCSKLFEGHDIFIKMFVVKRVS